MKSFNSFFFASALLATFTAHAAFREYPVGDPVEINGLKIGAVYFPAVAMDHSSMMAINPSPEMAGKTAHSAHMPKGSHVMNGAHTMSGPMHHSMSVNDADLQKEKFVARGKELIHLEADIHALANNPSGFAAGEWIPYLQISFALFEKGKSEALLAGSFMPMIAKDGPHYGTTIRMPGKGSYRLEYEISAPHLARHSDSKTGVAEYWKPFKASFDFDYEGFEKEKIPTNP